MIRILLLFISGMCFIVLNADRLIHYPDYANTGQNKFIGINSVKLTDTEAVFDISLYHHHGYWVRLNPGTKLIGKNTGKEYAIKSVSGIELGEKTYVPFTGYISTQIAFEPLAPADSVVDFIEPEGWKLKGIKLYDDTEGKIKTNISGSVESDKLASLSLYPIKQEAAQEKIYIVPVRNGEYNYNIYTDTPTEFVMVSGIGSPELLTLPRKFIAKGDSIIINYKYEDFGNEWTQDQPAASLTDVLILEGTLYNGNADELRKIGKGEFKMSVKGDNLDVKILLFQDNEESNEIILLDAIVPAEDFTPIIEDSVLAGIQIDRNDLNLAIYKVGHQVMEGVTSLATITCQEQGNTINYLLAIDKGIYKVGENESFFFSPIADQVYYGWIIAFANKFLYPQLKN